MFLSKVAFLFKDRFLVSKMLAALGTSPRITTDSSLPAAIPASNGLEMFRVLFFAENPFQDSPNDEKTNDAKDKIP